MKLQRFSVALSNRNQLFLLESSIRPILQTSYILKQIVHWVPVHAIRKPYAFVVGQAALSLPYGGGKKMIHTKMEILLEEYCENKSDMVK